MIYPTNFEAKIGFDTVRCHLRAACLSPLGQEKVDDMQAMDDGGEIREKLWRLREMQLLLAEHDDFPLDNFLDMRQSILRLRVRGTYLAEDELLALRRSLGTILAIKALLVPATVSLGEKAKYPHLQVLAEEVSTFPAVLRQIDALLDSKGLVRDSASPALAEIRQQRRQAESSVNKLLYDILHRAQQEGIIEKEAAPTLRDGRLVLPVSPTMKRRLPGIIHDESASGKTAFIEPAEVVETNNRIRTLAAEEHREVLRLLTAFADTLRPDVLYIAASYSLLAHIDFLHAKVLLAERYGATIPTVADAPFLDWPQARHPLLEEALRGKNRKIVPLDISLDEGRILIISGPNAGGKSVCLETVGLLQYMLQCGLAIPVRENARCGVFTDIMLDIGDEQSISDDLSTYSSHLHNMKQMMRSASSSSLLLIDEFGGGTEPQIGGALAEAILTRLWEKGTAAVITTHFQNLKHFADDHDGVVNGAMLYDRRELRPLFQLQIGRPGSSFAIEIARQIGLPEAVIARAADIVGKDYIQSDKYLQDIVRDKRYWETKRQQIHKQEKEMERAVADYETALEALATQRKEILAHAKEQAEELLREGNRRIENTIREIREQQAERAATKTAREALATFRSALQDEDTSAGDAAIDKKMAQIRARHARQQQRRAKKKEEGNVAPAVRQEHKPAPLTVGDSVRIKGLATAGVIEKIDGKTATVIMGGLRTTVATTKLEAVAPAVVAAQERRISKSAGEQYAALTPSEGAAGTHDTISAHSKAFHNDLDVRGQRSDEALNAVMHYIDDAILLGIHRVRILHGKGDGILRQLIRQYLSSEKAVAHFEDEHIQFGGTGITVVDLV